MHHSLQQFSEEEHQERIKQVEKIASKILLKPTAHGRS
jgi:hypothetical protein